MNPDKLADNGKGNAGSARKSTRPSASEAGGRSLRVPVIVALAALVVVAIVAVFVVTSSNGSSGGSAPIIGIGQVQVTRPANEYVGANHEQVEQELADRGFTNIVPVALGDIGGDHDTAEDGSVGYISIAGDSEFAADAQFPKDAEVLVAYHSLQEQESASKDVIES